jgi:hypothetical protein
MSTLFRTAIKAIPWEELIKQAPRILTAAAGLLGKTKKPNPTQPPSSDLNAQISQLREDIKRIQETEPQQADLMKDIAKQVELLSEGLGVLRARISLFAGLSAAALILSVIAIIGKF